ncbi:hypothetical protein SAMN06265222_101739 [Neorhodopirellula lusitana]|uniref:Uncharacterized protein n=1 Tax=Neorhodopirellula lusitana TaxID=445327 RepID=A0ABY1PQ72_9BACT|nr:hypothetical protein SAMN06265222_101739 [Neorhodopirellula lusitana]
MEAIKDNTKIRQAEAIKLIDASNFIRVQSNKRKDSRASLEQQCSRMQNLKHKPGIRFWSRTG